MTTAQTVTTSLHCVLSELTLTPTAPQAGLGVHDPVELGLSVTFHDEVEGHLLRLLMPLHLHIWISFHAQPVGAGPDLHLGDVMQQTQADVSTYRLRLVQQAGLAAAGLLAGQTYRIAAIARIGNSPFPVPAIARGYVDGIWYPAALAETPLSTLPAVLPSRRKTSRSPKPGQDS